MRDFAGPKLFMTSPSRTALVDVSRVGVSVHPFMPLLRTEGPRVVVVGSDAGRKPRNTAEAPQIAAVLAGVYPARDR
jgi:hypothetical protein